MSSSLFVAALVLVVVVVVPAIVTTGFTTEAFAFAFSVGGTSTSSSASSSSSASMIFASRTALSTASLSTTTKRTVSSSLSSLASANCASSTSTSSSGTYFGVENKSSFISSFAGTSSSRISLSTTSTTRLFMSSSSSSSKPGVATLAELQEFVEKAGNDLVVIDVRNPDADKEPGDQKSLAVAGLPWDSPKDNKVYRPNAINLIWDRSTDSMPLPDPATTRVVDKSTPIITHCGGGGRGQKAKEFLEKAGYTNVINGAGPKETELWNVYGHL